MISHCPLESLAVDERAMPAPTGDQSENVTFLLNCTRSTDEVVPGELNGNGTSPGKRLASSPITSHTPHKTPKSDEPTNDVGGADEDGSPSVPSLPPASTVSARGKFAFVQRAVDAARRGGDFEGWERHLYDFGCWLIDSRRLRSHGSALLCALQEFQRARKRVVISGTGSRRLDYLWTEVLRVQGSFQEALDFALEMQITDTHGTEDSQVRAFYLTGWLYRRLGHTEKAVAAFEKVLAQDPGHPDARAQLYSPLCGLRTPLQALDRARDASSSETKLLECWERGCCQETLRMLQRMPRWERLNSDVALVVEAGSLAASGRTGWSELYGLGQLLIRERPGSSIAAYVVGLFYQAIRKHDEARRYFFQAATLASDDDAPDVVSGAACVALGHSFAAWGDHDQAVAAYTAVVLRHCPGSALVSLLLAREYMRVRQPVLAAAYLVDVHQAIAQDRPRLLAETLNELSCLQAGKGDLVSALKLSRRAMDAWRESSSTGLGALRWDDLGLAIGLNGLIAVLKELKPGTGILGRLNEIREMWMKRELVEFAERSMLDYVPGQSHDLFPWHQAAGVAPPVFVYLSLTALVGELMASARLALESLSIAAVLPLLQTSLNLYQGMLQAGASRAVSSAFVQDIEERHGKLMAFVAGEMRIGEGCGIEVVPTSASLSAFASAPAAAVMSPSRVGKTPRTPLPAVTPLRRTFSGGSVGLLSSTRVLSSVSSTASVSSATSALNRRRSSIALRRQLTGLRVDHSAISDDAHGSFLLFATSAGGSGGGADTSFSSADSLALINASFELMPVTPGVSGEGIDGETLLLPEVSFLREHASSLLALDEPCDRASVGYNNDSNEDMELE